MTVEITPEVALALADVREACLNGEARRLRQEARLSLAEVGGVVGVTLATVQRWELGRRLPRGEPAKRYASLLAVLASRADRDAV